MKHKKLIVLIVICLFVLIASLTAGIALTLNTVGWADLQVPGHFQEKLDELFKDGQFAGLFTGKKISMTVNKSFSQDLTGIKKIKISGVSEEIKLEPTDGKQAQFSLTGNYFTLLREIDLVWEKNGDVLLVHPQYPKFGFINVSLVQQILIPADFAGEIQINNVSGSCTVTGQDNLAWTKLQLINVSGHLAINKADLPAIEFDSVSGKASIAGCTAAVTGKTVSGSMVVEWQTFAKSSFNTVSGKTELVLPAETSCQLTYKTVSGSFSNADLPMQISSQSARQISGNMNNGRESLAVESISGNLVMRKP
jgi:hypothetical protein